MKKHLLPLFALFTTGALQAGAQVTKLSNNTGLSGVVVNGKPILVTQLTGEFWTTDGTPGGTARYTTKVVSPDGDSPESYLFQNKLFFGGSTVAEGNELWVTDGTDAGTALIKNINAGAASSSPESFFELNGTLFFWADNGANGKELWKTDGTNAGTTLVKDINPGAPSSISNSGLQTYKLNGIAFFTADNGANGIELWKTDGTTAGTALVKDINPGPAGSTSLISSYFSFESLANNVFFFADNGTNGLELWKSDGSNAGTSMVKDANTSLIPSFFPNLMYKFNNKIYYSYDDGINGSELWVTDGTTAGTNLLKDINPDGESSMPYLLFPPVINGKFFFTATDADHGAELWCSDGTAAGTTLLKDINPGTQSSDAFVLPNFSSFFQDQQHQTLFNGKMFIQATTAANGQELWITDGTSAGTVLVKDINPGTEDGMSSLSYFYTKSGLYFSATNGTTGVEPWKSDGTSAGTQIVKDIHTGAEDSGPQFLFIYNSKLYFMARDADNVTDTDGDLFRTDGDEETLPITLLSFKATLEGKSVNLGWSTSTEINSSHFTVQRSTDGQSFETIGKVTAAGNSTIARHYTFTDGKALQTGVNRLYYRLLMVDKDGSSKLSPIADVRLNNLVVEARLSPNPAKDVLNISLSNAGAKSLSLRITDISGKPVYLQKLNNAGNQQRINVAGLSKGVYYLQVVTDDGAKTIKFVKE
ncbi:ELWxxDGT repeat protein [Foetidibacter luteolus]|uniref:ELWxxDGT repeat protein n=1 Tax=Foetidibacter luteolus TaxID=2608880 RepID=UPI00129B27D6|nr:ELWxxDGT repeat protein [Foetidibacter luteolus]